VKKTVNSAHRRRTFRMEAASSSKSGLVMGGCKPFGWGSSSWCETKITIEFLRLRCALG
jgi:hypothetical protein